MKRLQKIGKYLAWWGFTGCLGAVLITASAFLYLSPKLPPAESYKSIRLENPLRVYTQDKKLIAEFGNQKREPIKFQDIPPDLVNALVVSEDHRFYSHHGVSLLGLLRSISGILTGNRSGGASTLTMQVTKNISFEGESATSRKFKEILLALQIERELSKEEILELYMNRTFFGISAYGISAAARQYYDKTPAELSLAEMAMMIAILPAPNSLNPLRSEEKAVAYRGRVLRRMHEFSMINDEQYKEAKNAPVTAQRYGRQPDLDAPYIAEMVRLEMIERYGDLALIDGFEVYTTIDSHMQETAIQALRTGLETYDRRHGYRGPEGNTQAASDGTIENWLAILARTPTIATQQAAFVESVEERSITALLRSGESIVIEWDGFRWAKRFINTNAWGSSPRSAQEVVSAGDLIRVRRNPENEWMIGQIPAVNGALISIDPNNGAIRALTGGYDYYDSNAGNFNRATQAERQPGSNFKPFLYSAALENGYTAASLINDAPIASLAKRGYRPKNYGDKYLGFITIREALTKSINTVAVRLYETVGEDIVLPYISRFGFNDREFPSNDPSIAIGSHAVKPITIATGYTVFANGGYKVEPHFIDRIDNFNDGEVFRSQPYVVCEECESLTAIDSMLAENQVPEVETFIPAPRVIDEDVAYIMNSMLRSVITNGSARRANREMDRQDIKGKTGTTNDSNELWFSGFNSDLVTTVYVGFDQDQTLGDSEEASLVPLPIWIDFMDEVLKGTPESNMPQPDGLVTVRINRGTGLKARPNEDGAIFEVFREENVPDFDLDKIVNDDSSSEKEESSIF